MSDDAKVTVLTAADYQRAAEALGCSVATVKAVVEIEAGGTGFLTDGRPKILYEAHVFHRLTKGKFASAKDRHGVKLSSAKWDRSLYGRTGTHQWSRMDDAAKFDWPAAHRASSWGAGQVLGENHRAAGYTTIELFVAAMMQGGAGVQLDAMVNFIISNNLDGALRQRDWQRFARGYNGPGYAQNQYDRKLASAYAKHAAA